MASPQESCLKLLSICFSEMKSWQHAVMQHADNGDTIVGYAVVDSVASHPQAAITLANVINRLTTHGKRRQHLEPGNEFICVTVGLFQSPLLKSVRPNALHVAFGLRR